MIKFRSRQLKRLTMPIATTAILALLILGGLELGGITHFIRKTPINYGSGTIPAKIQKDNSSNISSSESPQNSSSNNKTGTGANEADGESLAAPSGTFISNHKPNLSGSPRPSAVQSTCITTPGASCYISFTKGQVVKKLDSEIADASGSVFWTWDIKTSGFTEGIWQVQAVSSIGSATQVTIDPIPLEVSQ